MSENSTNDKVASLGGIVEIVYLSRDNCVITDKNGFLGLTATVPKIEDSLLADEPSGEKKDEKKDESKDGEVKEKEKKKDTPAVSVKDLGNGMVEKTAERIFLSRAFPFDMPFEYISVLDRDKKEIGLIRSIDDFDEEARALLIRELDTKYYTPKIKRILSVKERYGFSYWKCECEFGETSFTLKDTFRSIVKAGSEDGHERAFIIDIDGNRYEIPDVEALDRMSYKKIELYL